MGQFDPLHKRRTQKSNIIQGLKATTSCLAQKNQTITDRLAEKLFSEFYSFSKCIKQCRHKIVVRCKTVFMAFTSLLLTGSAERCQTRATDCYSHDVLKIFL